MPAAGITVRVYYVGFAGQDAKLGETKSYANGKYAISFTPTSGSPTNLQVRVLDAAGKEVTISNTKFNAQSSKTLNLVVPTTVQPLGPELQRLAADMDKANGGHARLGLADESEAAGPEALELNDWDARIAGPPPLLQEVQRRAV
jgi:hypothetical protein